MWWEYDELSSRSPYDWSPAVRGDCEWDTIDFHVDLGCGTVPKARLGIDRHLAPGVDLCIDLERMIPAVVPPEQGFNHDRTLRQYREFKPGIGEKGLPFPTSSIESIISHHCLEHIGDGFVPLMDEIHRVLKPGGVLRAITPLFPSKSAVEDPDHKRYFMEETWETFCGAENGDHWHESFSVPYTSCRFEMVHKDITAREEDPAEWWGPKDVREIRVALRKYGEEANYGRTGERDIQEGRRGSEALPADDLGGHSEVGRNAQLAGVQ